MDGQREIHIGVANNKGGAAKTMTVINLAYAFALEGKRVIVIDGDKNRSSKNWAVRRASQDPFPVMTMAESMKYSKPKDIVIYDTAGGINDKDIEDLMAAVDYLVVPCKPDVTNQEATEEMTTYFTRHKVPYRVLISDASSAGEFGRAKQLAEYFEVKEVPMFGEFIPRSMKLVDAFNEGKTIAEISGARSIVDQFVKTARQILADMNTLPIAAAGAK